MMVEEEGARPPLPPDTAPPDVIPELGQGVVKPRESSRLQVVADAGRRWAKARVHVLEWAMFRDDALRPGDVVLIAERERGIVHPPALVQSLSPERSTWPEDENIAVEAAVLIDHSLRPLDLSDVPELLVEQLFWSTGSAQGEMRGCLLDLWQLDLTCPRCGGRGVQVQPKALSPGSQQDSGAVPGVDGAAPLVFMHRYACHHCGTGWGGAPRFANPDLLDLAREGGVIRDVEISEAGSTPVQLRWLNTLLDGVGELLEDWRVHKFFTDFAARYGRTVGVDLRRGPDAMELEYQPAWGTVSCWDLALDGSDGPHTTFSLELGAASATRAIAEAGLFSDPRYRQSIILVWQPGDGDEWEPSHLESATRAAGGDVLPEGWSLDSDIHIPPGTEVFLLLQGERWGIVGHGFATAGPMSQVNLSDPGRGTPSLPVEWDALLPLEGMVEGELLESEVPDVPWQQIDSSGWTVRDESVADLRELWAQYVV